MHGVCLCLGMHMEVQIDAHRLEASDAPGAGVAGCCKASDMGSEDLTWAF